MKTKRAYIECSISAALAAKNHGFKYKGIDNALDPLNYVSIREEWTAMKFYIAKESLYLLNCSMGDYIAYLLKDGSMTIGKVTYVDDMYVCVGTGKYMDKDETCLVIKNGLPFPKISYKDNPLSLEQNTNG